MRGPFDLLRQRDMVRVDNTLDDLMRSVSHNNSYQQQQQLANFMSICIQELNNTIHEEIGQARIKEKDNG